jgi:type IV pilus assembly protein PilV
MELSNTRKRPIGATHRPKEREAGFTLLEVLVAIVVLSFGLVCVVGLQAIALQANKEARNQSSALRLARELGDMMRGNKDIALLTTASNPYLVPNFTGGAATAPENCATSACSTTTTIAQFEMSDWLSRVDMELPGVRVVVCYDSTPYTSSGQPQWDCTGTGGMAVVKMGWTRQSTNRSLTGAAALDKATTSTSTPAVVVPLIAGSAT